MTSRVEIAEDGKTVCVFNQKILNVVFPEMDLDLDLIVNAEIVMDGDNVV